MKIISFRLILIDTNSNTEISKTKWSDLPETLFNSIFRKNLKNGVSHILQEDIDYAYETVCEIAENTYMKTKYGSVVSEDDFEMCNEFMKRYNLKYTLELESFLKLCITDRDCDIDGDFNLYYMTSDFPVSDNVSVKIEVRD